MGGVTSFMPIWAMPWGGGAMAAAAVPAIGEAAVGQVKSAQQAGEEEKRRADELLKLQQDQLDFAKQQGKDQQTQQQALIDKQNAQNAQASSDASRNMQQTRQRKRAQAGQSYRDTILTGPQGLTASSDTSTKKTLLGM